MTPNPVLVAQLLDRLIEEDAGFSDLTTCLLIPEGQQGAFALVAREACVAAGLDFFAALCRRIDPGVAVEPATRDGEALERGARLATVRGPARAILTAERPGLNLVQHLSGIATLTARYAERIAGTGATLIDTRKTTPGLRLLEKYAVVMGGGRNHRLRLDDGVLIKDNHIAQCGGLAQAVARAKARVPVLSRVEVECDRLDQVREALDAGADMILLDNMAPATLREAVALVGGRVPLEASGGIALDTIRAVAETGVDFISVGRITQSAPAIDIGLDEA